MTGEWMIAGVMGEGDGGADDLPKGVTGTVAGATIFAGVTAVLVGVAAGGVVLGVVSGGVVIGTVVGELATVGLLAEFVSGPAISTPQRVERARTTRAAPRSGVLFPDRGRTLSNAASCANAGAMPGTPLSCSTGAVALAMMAVSTWRLRARCSLVGIENPAGNIPIAAPISVADANRRWGRFSSALWTAVMRAGSSSGRNQSTRTGR
jgi:hypothetical protein